MLSLQLIALLLFAVFVLHIWNRSRRALPLPRGPRGWPILGNIFDAPQEKPHKAYLEMGHKYGSYMDFLTLCTIGRELNY